MKKNNVNYCLGWQWRKFLLMMKFLWFFIVAGLISANAAESYSQNTRIDLNIKNATLKSILSKIEEKTEFYFFYKNDEIETLTNLSIRVNHAAISKVLDDLLKDKGFVYETYDRYILIQQKKVNQSVDIKVLDQNKITGKVTDSSGTPLPGVTVLVKGTTNGTVTNASGDYSLGDVSGESTLQFSFVGMRMQEVVVGNKTSINVMLQEEAIGIDEVVAIGYGTKKRVTITGAVASVNSDQILTTKNQNVQNTLAGKIPGVRVVQKTSEPGTFSNLFDIRGFGSPLIVIDGVPRENFVRLDANEIESVSVLKDASAAVYGVQAANGVVLVTTKNGKAGKAEIEYTGYYGLQSPIGLPKPVGTVERFTLMNEWYMHDVDNPNTIYDSDEFEPYLNGSKTGTDWYDMVLKSTAAQQQHNITVSGGSQDSKIDYFINMGYLTQDGLYTSNDLNYEKYNLRSNVNAQISDRLKASLKINGTTYNKDEPYYSDTRIFSALWRVQPNESFYANDNTNYLYKIGYGYHPGAMSDADISGYRKTNNKLFQSQFELQYKVPYIDGLLAKGMFSYDVSVNDYASYQKVYKLYTYDTSSDSYIGSENNTPEKLSRSYNVNPSTLMQLSLNYDHTFLGKHNVGALFVYEERTRSMDNFSAARKLGLSLDYLFAGLAENQVGNSDIGKIWKYANKALVGRLGYDFESKYIAELSFRYDGSSKFPPNKRWGFFPAASIGWRISEESFFKDIVPASIINNLKLRYSYGEMGDDAALAYQFISGYDYPYNGSSSGLAGGYLFNGEFVNALGFRSAPNTDITWFTATTINAGADIDFFDSKLALTFDVFKRDRDGLLADRLLSLPGTFGTTMPQENLNSDQTKGFELSLTHRGKIKDFLYSATGNLSYTRTKNMYLERGASGNSYDNWLNNWSNRYNDIWFGLGYEGQFQSYEEIINNDYFVDRSVLPGDYIYEDWNNDGVIDDMDRHPLATTSNPTSDDRQNYPLINFGLDLSFKYKGFDLNLLFQGAAMSYVAYREQLLYPLAWYGNALDIFLDRWHPTDPTADPYNPDTDWAEGYYAYTGTIVDENSEFNIQDAAYLRLKSVELGYTLPHTWIEKSGIENLRLFLNGYNLFTITGVKGVDPEHPSEDYSYRYPLCRTINMGVSVTF